MVETLRPKILIVDDTPANLIALHRLLKKIDVEVIQATSGKNALAMTLDHDFALFLLDVHMPEMDGYELAKSLQSNTKTQDVPIIFITAALVDDNHRTEGYTQGAIDYIEKPINNNILITKVNILIKLWQKNNQLNQIMEEIAERNFALQTEVAERKKIQAKLDHLAMYDPLTNLPNRALLKKESEKQLSAADRYDYQVGVMLVDLDGFKTINDCYGHETGDAVLVEMSYRIVSAVRVCDIVTRFGGDEFIILLPNCKSKSDIEMISNRILQKINQPQSSVDSKQIIGASIGIAIYPEDSRSTNELISLADKAMCQAKQGGKNQFNFSNPATAIS